jgi:hypothetical protein
MYVMERSSIIEIQRYNWTAHTYICMYVQIYITNFVNVKISMIADFSTNKISNYAKTYFNLLTKTSRNNCIAHFCPKMAPKFDHV